MGGLFYFKIIQNKFGELRNTYYTCRMKDNKRHPHSYKSKSDVYNKAMRRAKKEKGNLSNLLENVVTCYAYGLEIRAVKYSEGGGAAHALDTFALDNAVIIESIKKIK